MESNGFSKRLIKMVLNKENRESVKDVNLSQLSKKIQIPPATFHQWLSGAFPKRVEHWIKLQEYFNCSLTYLITGITPKHNEIPLEGKIVVSDNGRSLITCNYKIRKNLAITCPFV